MAEETVPLITESTPYCRITEILAETLKFICKMHRNNLFVPLGVSKLVNGATCAFSAPWDPFPISYMIINNIIIIIIMRTNTGTKVIALRHLVNINRQQWELAAGSTGFCQYLSSCNLVGSGYRALKVRRWHHLLTPNKTKKNVSYIFWIDFVVSARISVILQQDAYSVIRVTPGETGR